LNADRALQLKAVVGCFSYFLGVPMKTLLLGFVIVIWFGVPVFAQSPVITPKEIGELPINGVNRKPKITLQDALKVAERFAKHERINLSDHFLLEARMIGHGEKDEP